MGKILLATWFSPSKLLSDFLFDVNSAGMSKMKKYINFYLILCQLLNLGKRRMWVTIFSDMLVF